MLAWSEHRNVLSALCKAEYVVMANSGEDFEAAMGQFDAALARMHAAAVDAKDALAAADKVAVLAAEQAAPAAEPGPAAEGSAAVSALLRSAGHALPAGSGVGAGQGDKRGWEGANGQADKNGSPALSTILRPAPRHAPRLWCSQGLLAVRPL